MNRGEFLAELRAQLADFSEEAREDALKFYEEYLDEAGPENEGVVLAELGSPQKVARIIRANCDSGAAEPAAAPRAPQHGLDWRAPRAPKPPKPDIPRTEPEGNESAPDGASADGETRRAAYAYHYPPGGGRAGGDRTLWIILLIATCPLWIGAFFGLIGGAFGLAGGLIGLVFGGIGTMIAGFIALGSGVGLLFSALPSGILMIGVSLLCVACGAFLAAFSLWVVTKLIPLALRAVRWLWRRLFANGR